MPLVLASASKARRALLEAAGLEILTDPAALDEAAVKASLASEGAGSADIALALAELKALRVSPRHPGLIVLGADQILECEGQRFDKPEDLAAARAQLRALEGRRHRLISALVALRDGQRLWHHCGEALLTMRRFSGAFLESYLAAAGPAVLGSVGAYQLEGRGAQLFTRVEGDYFTVLGLPLLPLLDFLRLQGELAA
ncbi:MAG TPA: Maf family protein [Dongiaceae bacterium]|nr:Maf family protein [Dongiaceae bacterium]